MMVSHDRSRSARLVSALSQSGVLIALIALLVFGGVRYASLNFLGAYNVVSVLQGTAPYALTALGMCFVIITGGIDLSVGSVVGLSGVVAALLSPYGPGVALLGAVGAGLVVGLVNGLIITRLNIQPFITTLATLLGAHGAALLLSHNAGVTVAPAVVDLGQIKWLSIGIMLGAYVIGAVTLRWARFGRNALAVGGGADASRLMGLNVPRVLMGVYLLSGALAGLAGLLISAQSGAGQPNEGGGWELSAIAAVVVGGTLLTGGVGSVWATLTGSLLLGVILNMLNFENGLGVVSLSPYWQSVIRGGFLLVVVVLQSRAAQGRDP
ncbi:ABC transporter permease [Deinococcus sp.]|uniref:ABC transporter permease n=1 Tax=Deinococcus sp. TaxID=47478 RepID=UPI0028699C58|nr:ABC transporter permease [Deinococcus sp.]